MFKTIHIQYFAILREQRGVSEETFTTNLKTAQELYALIDSLYFFSLTPDMVRVAINNEFCPWETILKSGDHVVFIPPVAGG
jgi:molybdopterin converting factor subunit 1